MHNFSRTFFISQAGYGCLTKHISDVFLFRKNQQTHQFLSVYYFTLLLLHVSATVCHPQETRLYLLSYMPLWVLVDKTLCGM
jgi:hypothetical protein